MPTPPRVLRETDYRRLERLVRENSRQISSLKNSLAAFGVRRHQGGFIPATAQRGIAVLTATLSQGSSATADELAINASDALEYTGRELTLWDWQQNLTESVPSGTKLEWFKIGTRYFASNPYCAVSDTLPA